MNKVILMGRLTHDPEIRYRGSGEQMCIARFSLAVDRRFGRRGDETTADFFNCTAFGKLAEFVEKYLGRGTKILLTGRIENNNYTNRDGQKVYSVQVMADEIEFAESRAASASQGGNSGRREGGESFPPPAPDNDGFMHIPDDVDDEELPWN